MLESPFQDDPDFEQHQLQTAAWTAIWASAGAAVSNFDVMPRRPSSLASRSVCGFLVVSRTSPMKMELAPATKHSACNSSVIYCRPADRLTRCAPVVVDRIRRRTHRTILW